VNELHELWERKPQASPVQRDDGDTQERDDLPASPLPGVPEGLSVGAASPDLRDDVVDIGDIDPDFDIEDPAMAFFILDAEKEGMGIAEYCRAYGINPPRLSDRELSGYEPQ
jgi:hypothetical protein